MPAHRVVELVGPPTYVTGTLRCMTGTGPQPADQRPHTCMHQGMDPGRPCLPQPKGSCSALEAAAAAAGNGCAPRLSSASRPRARSSALQVGGTAVCHRRQVPLGCRAGGTRAARLPHSNMSSNWRGGRRGTLCSGGRATDVGWPARSSATRAKVPALQRIQPCNDSVFASAAALVGRDIIPLPSWQAGPQRPRRGDRRDNPPRRVMTGCSLSACGGAFNSLPFTSRF